MLHSVKEIKEVIPYKVRLKFNTGEVKEVDLEEKLKEWSRTPGSTYRQLLEPGYFIGVKLNKEIETIYWDNGIDFCPDVLYSLAR
jgi:hypothetical protein